MPQRLDDLYHEFYTPLKLIKLKSSVEENHKILIDRLSRDDLKTVLRIIDALEMICNYQCKNSFIQGFKLGFELTTKLQTYDVHSAEIDSQNCGHSFMPQEIQNDETEEQNSTGNYNSSSFSDDDNNNSKPRFKHRNHR